MSADLEQARKGTFITFEGGDGAGKSTHIRFLAQALEGLGREVVRVREPGGTAIGEQLRAVVLDPENGQMAPECELLVYEAARAQITAQVIAPALERGAVVLCDRFYDSTVAYQGFGRGLPLEFVRAANRFAARGLVPDRTVLMRTPEGAAAALERATRASGPDRMEAEGVSFHERVDAAFDRLPEAAPDRVRVVETAPTKAETARAVFAAVADCFGWDPQDLPFPDAFFAAANDLHGISRETHGAQAAPACGAGDPGEGACGGAAR